MSQIRLLFSLFTIVLFVFEPVSGLNCWECKSRVNPGCEDPFMPGNFAQQACHSSDPGYLPVCLKIVQRENGHKSYLRMCSKIRINSTEINTCRRYNDRYSVLVDDCNCITDGCSGSSTIEISLGLLFTVSLFWLGRA